MPPEPNERKRVERRWARTAAPALSLLVLVAPLSVQADGPLDSIASIHGLDDEEPQVYWEAPPFQSSLPATPGTCSAPDIQSGEFEFQVTYGSLSECAYASFLEFYPPGFTHVRPVPSADHPESVGDGRLTVTLNYWISAWCHPATPSEHYDLKIWYGYGGDIGGGGLGLPGASIGGESETLVNVQDKRDGQSLRTVTDSFEFEIQNGGHYEYFIKMELGTYQAPGQYGSGCQVTVGGQVDHMSLTKVD